MSTPWQQRAWVQWGLFLLFWTLVGTAFAAQLYLSRARIGEPVSWSFALGRSLADWYVFAILSIPALWVAGRFPLESGRWRANLSIHLGASVLFSMFWMALRAAIELWLSRGPILVSFSAVFGQAFAGTFFLNVLYYWMIVSVGHAVDYYRKLGDRELQSVELQGRLTQARLQALQMQLNPHFLFNTLNAISSLMHRDVEAADRMIAELSDLLRYALESTHSQEVALGQELHFLDRYLKIQQARFGDRLKVTREIDPETLAASVPNLALQPLVENALDHGIAPHARVGELTLRARRRDGNLELEVQDNGGGLPPGHGPDCEGVGLSNTRARLQQLYGAAHSLELLPAPGRGLIVRLKLPWKVAAEEIEAGVKPARRPALNRPDCF